MRLDAQPGEYIRMGNVSVETDFETVSISFTAESAAKAVPSGTTVVLAPVITDGEHKVSLPPIIIEDRRAEKNWARHEWAAGIRAHYEDGIYIGSGSVSDYHADVPYQPWMQDARIDVEIVKAAALVSTTDPAPLVSDIELKIKGGDNEPNTGPEPEFINIPDTETDSLTIHETELGPILDSDFKIGTVNEFRTTTLSTPAPELIVHLTETLPFILPAAEFVPEEPLKLYNDERDNALTVYYKINSYTIEEDYAGNGQTLINLLAAIRLIRESGLADVDRVVIVGFASPEGSFEYNDYLAWQRAEAIGAYIEANTDLPKGSILLVNGSADWRGLSLAIMEDPAVPMREEALDIIGNNPVGDPGAQSGREILLRNLAGGETYRYLAEYIFPKLRNGAFVRVYYDNNE